MTRHGWRKDRRTKLGRACVAVLAAAFMVVPAQALAIDSPLAPVSPGTDPAAHGMGLEPAPVKVVSAATAERGAAAAADLPAAVDLTPWALPPGDQGQVNSCAAWATGYTALGYYLNRQGVA